MQTCTEASGAEVFQGNIHDPQYITAMQNWVSSASGNMMTDFAHQLKFDADAVMNVITSAFFKSTWDEKFNRSRTKQDVFHAAEGDIHTSYMYRQETLNVLFGDHFTAINSPFVYYDSMLFILPEEGYTPEDILKGEQVYTLMGAERWNLKHEKYIVHERIPRFDITDSINAETVLKQAGVTNVFDELRADFTSVIRNEDGAYITEIQHRCRMMIDEDGCKGAGVSVAFAMACAAARHPGKYEFTLDRPFIAVVLSRRSLPLFVCIVNEPITVSENKSA